MFAFVFSWVRLEKIFLLLLDNKVILFIMFYSNLQFVKNPL